MKLRSIALAAVGFVLGVATLFEVEAHTSWLARFQRHTEYKAAHTPAMPWVHGHEESVDFDMKFLFNDPGTHEVSMLLRYPAGQVNPDHIHNYGHGMYVLQGKLLTHRGTYLPGDFVWFPANEVVSHGATPDEDVVVFFLRHEDMTTEHVRAAVH
jgi:quercetin dioxygenase-like cupin family protein